MSGLPRLETTSTRRTLARSRHRQTHRARFSSTRGLRSSMRLASLLILAGVGAGFSQPPGPAGGPGAARPAVSASVRLEDWALFRSAAAPVLGWKIGVPSAAFRRLTFSEAAAKADAL